MSGEGVVVTLDQMYGLLLTVDSKVTALVSESAQDSAVLRDHEARLRDMESREDYSRRIGQVETDLSDAKDSIDGLKRLVYALPATAAVTAIVAIVVSISDKF